MNNGAVGRSLELYFIGGKADGMVTAVVPFNWTGFVLKAPRTQLSEALQRPETTSPGVYLLLGEKDGRELSYIGESEDPCLRIKSHDSKRDWWTSVIFVTSTDNALNKAHVKYLESRLVEIAKRVDRIALENANTPPRPRLSEANVSNMEGFLENLLTILPALRVDIFLEDRRSEAAVSPAAAEVQFELVTRKHGITAYAAKIGADFVVLKDSLARSKWEGQGTEKSGPAILHKELCERGILRPSGAHMVFAENYAFSSPSTAAAVVNGRPANGTIEWKVKGTAQTYKAWEEEQLARVSPSIDSAERDDFGS